MADYGDLARNLLQKYLPKFGTFGGDITYRKLAPASYNSETGDVDAPLVTSFTLYGVLLTFGSITGAGKTRQIDDRTPLNIDRELIVAAADMQVEPEIGDQVQADGELWRIIAINQDPRPAHYSLHVRPWGALP